MEKADILEVFYEHEQVSISGGLAEKIFSTTAVIIYKVPQLPTPPTLS